MKKRNVMIIGAGGIGSFLIPLLDKVGIYDITVYDPDIVEEKNLTFDDLLTADEAFYSGTAVEITPITKVDGSTIGSGSIGAITDQLQTNYSNIVCGRDKSYSHWLTSI